MDKRYIKIMSLLVLIGIVIRCIYSYIDFNFSYTSDKYNKEYFVEVLGIEKDTENMTAYLVKLKQNNKFKSKFILNVYDKNEAIYVKGDILKITGKIVIPEVLNNPGEFNYKRYLNSKGIYGTITANSIEFNQHISTTSLVDKIKLNMDNIIDSSMNERYSNLLKSMLYGYTVYLEEDIKENFEKIGVSHVTSASGSNLAVIVSILSFLLTKIKCNKYFKCIINLIVTCIFSIICSSEYSILRASICFVIVSLGEVFNKKISYLKCMVVSFIVLLVVNPYCVFNVGLQLSYGATLGIILFNNKIYGKFQSIIKRFKKQKIRCFILKSVFSCLSVTLSAQIFILPIQIETFNAFSLSMFLSNIIINIISVPILFLGMLALIFNFIPIFSIVICKIIYPFILSLDFISNALAKTAIEIVIPGQLPVIWLLYYLVIFSFIVIDKYVIQIIKVKKKYIKKASIIKFLICVVFVIFVVTLNIHTIYLDNYLYFFNVGQGSLNFLRYKGQNILIDAGSTKSSNASNAIINFLESRGINKIHLIVITHFHKDHVSAIEKIIENYEVGKVIYSEPKEETQLYNTLLETFKLNNIQTSIVDSEDIITLNEIKLRVLSPFENYIIQDEDITNANSMSLLVTIENKNYLFMGDATKETEKYIMENMNISDIFLLVVGHHGSKDATSEEFVKKALPKIAVISSKQSVYGHPNEEVLGILNKYNVNTLITEKLGAIKIKI